LREDFFEGKQKSFSKKILLLLKTGKNENKEQK